jgi:hypothetical protein
MFLLNKPSQAQSEVFLEVDCRSHIFSRALPCTQSYPPPKSSVQEGRFEVKNQMPYGTRGTWDLRCLDLWTRTCLSEVLRQPPSLIQLHVYVHLAARVPHKDSQPEPNTEVHVTEGGTLGSSVAASGHYKFNYK